MSSKLFNILQNNYVQLLVKMNSLLVRSDRRLVPAWWRGFSHQTSPPRCEMVSHKCTGDGNKVPEKYLETFGLDCSADTMIEMLLGFL